MVLEAGGLAWGLGMGHRMWSKGCGLVGRGPG